MKTGKSDNTYFNKEENRHCLTGNNVRGPLHRLSCLHSLLTNSMLSSYHGEHHGSTSLLPVAEVTKRAGLSCF